jgi:multicomponent Na+:H+ antiporter subunit G
METLFQVLAAIALLVGSLFSIVGILGMFRFPDVYTRLHATGKVSVFGAVLVLFATILLTPLGVGKGLVLIALLLLSAPVVSHAIVSAAYRAGIPMERVSQDDLSEHLAKIERIEPDLVWLYLGNGRLGIDHRPGQHRIRMLKSAGADVVVTLLRESEGARAVENWVKQEAMEWMWLPMPDGRPPVGELLDQFIEAIPEISKRLDHHQSVFIHCSAGIHRTGMIALAVLRYRGLSEADAMALLAQMRIHTYNGLRSNHRKWAAQFAQH